MSNTIIYALAAGLAAVDIFVTSMLAFWLGCKIFDVEFDLKTAAAVSLLVLLVKGI